MKTRRIGDSFHAAFWSVAALAGLAIASSPGTATTIRVPADQPTIQAGIDAASNGDQVLVAPGIYTGSGNKNLDLHLKDIVVRAEFGPKATIIDCEGSGRGFVLFGAYPASTRIEGFGIQNGNGDGDLLGGGGMAIGGGAPTINGCFFTGNTASGSSMGGGGGLVCHNSSALIEDCVFLQNIAAPNAGAVGGGLASHEGTPTIRGCQFIENTALGVGGGGGGIYVHFLAPTPGVVIERCEFVGNKARLGGAGIVLGSHVSHCTVDGNEGHPEVGGIALSFSLMESVLFTDNSSETAGGAVEAINSTLTDCLLARNRAVWGGGIWAIGSTIERCVLSDNQADVGGGLYCTASPASSFVRCTVVRNRAMEGSGIAVTSPVGHHLQGSIVANGIGGSAIACLGDGAIDVTCTDLFGNQGGDWVGCVADQAAKHDNFSADPLFCAPDGNNFTLTANSPCLPGNHPTGANCGVIGAEDEGCGAVAVEATTWGRIKARSWSR